MEVQGWLNKFFSHIKIVERPNWDSKSYLQNKRRTWQCPLDTSRLLQIGKPFWMKFLFGNSFRGKSARRPGQFRPMRGKEQIQR